MKELVTDRGAALGLSLLTVPAGWLPGPTERLLASLGAVSWWLRPALRRRITANLLPFCDGDEALARRRSRQVLRNVGRYFVDLARLPSVDLRQLTDERVTIWPRANIPAVTDPGPVIIVSAHWGAPEISLQAAVAHGRPFLAVVEKLDRPHFREQLRDLRESQGGIFVDTDLAGTRDALRWLRRGGLVGFVVDRDIEGNGICVEFGGRQVRFARGPWELAQRTGARIVPVFAGRTGHLRYGAELCDPFTIAQDSGESGIMDAVQHFASMLEVRIRRAPGQWTVLEDYWGQHDCG